MATFLYPTFFYEHVKVTKLSLIWHSPPKEILWLAGSSSISRVLQQNEISTDLSMHQYGMHQCHKHVFEKQKYICLYEKLG